jgi:O-acetylhomoserine/O-acetylserine sulfhydrylase-like pyridoxal-dependent enzyme
MRASFAEEKERNIYSRFSNPNTSEFIQKVCQMEGSEDGVAFLHYYSMGKADNIKAIAEEIF